MNLSFGQKLLLAFSLLLLLVMGAFTISSDIQLQKTTSKHVDAMLGDSVEQSTESIAEWLNTRLDMTEAVSKALQGINTDEEARRLFQATVSGGGFSNVYVGKSDGFMLMQTEEADATLPEGYDPRERPWYEKAQRLGQPSFTKPYTDAGTNELIISTLAPVQAGAYQGVVGADIGLGAIEEILESVNLGNNGYTGLINANGDVLFHPNSDLVGKNIRNLLNTDPSFDGKSHEYQIDGTSWTAQFHPISKARGVDWYLGTFINQDKINAPIRDARVTGLFIAVIGLAIALVLLHFGIKTLMSPLRNLNRAMSDIATGDADLTKRLSVDTKDELGDLANSFNRFVENIQTVVSDVQKGSADLSSGVKSLRDTASTTRNNVDKQQAEINMVATAINEMSTAANEIAQNALSTADAASTADKDSREALTTVTAARNEVQALAEEINSAASVIENLGKDVGSITSVLEVIEGIAEQTNLLALNAAIEAARAGESGRGFAVVAEEVRNLAQRTQKSTEEVNDMTERLQKGATKAVEVMNASTAKSNVSMEKAQDSMEALGRIADSITRINEMTSQIATASEEQTSVTEELNSSIVRIADQGQEVATSASENDVYSSQIDEVGNALENNVSRFKV